MRLLHAVLLASLALYSVFGQTYTISTFAGGALPIQVWFLFTVSQNGITVSVQ